MTRHSFEEKSSLSSVKIFLFIPIHVFNGNDMHILQGSGSLPYVFDPNPAITIKTVVYFSSDANYVGIIH